MAIAAATEAEHVGHDFGRTRPRLLNAIQQFRDFAGLQVAVDRIEVYACQRGVLNVLGQVVGQAPPDVLHVMQNGTQWIIDLIPAARPPTESIFSD